MTEPALIELRKFLLSNLGLNYNDSQDKELCNKIGKAAKSFNYSNNHEFITWLIRQELNQEQTEKLASAMTIGETYFFREKKALDYLKNLFLPNLLLKRRNEGKYLRIWSAGCATGEEPYSIAILLRSIIPDIDSWDITILATDINVGFLGKARSGVYSKWSFRGTSESFRRRHFKQTGKNKYSVNQSVKRMVKFSYLNLATDAYPSPKNNSHAFDIIFCRNVLIYFSNDGIKLVTSKFYDSLLKGGVMLLSPVEVSSLISTKFNRFMVNGITVFSKDPHAKVRVDKTKIAVKFKFDIPEPKRKTQKISKPLVRKKTIVKKEVARPTNKEILALARNKANDGQLDESEKLCLQAIDVDKIDPQAHYLLSTVLSEQGKMSEAITALNRTLFLDPNLALAHFLLGNISQTNGKMSETKRHYTNAIKSLDKVKPDEAIAESDGLTAGRLKEIINSIMDIAT